MFYFIYLWWNLSTLHWLACQVRVTVGDSGLCCCVCLTSFERYIDSFVCWLCTSARGLVPFQILSSSSFFLSFFIFYLLFSCDLRRSKLVIRHFRIPSFRTASFGHVFGGSLCLVPDATDHYRHVFAPSGLSSLSWKPFCSLTSFSVDSRTNSHFLFSCSSISIK